MSEELRQAVGKTIRAVEQETQHHSLDGPADDGAITIEFTDGTKLMIEGVWCNDDTAATAAWWRQP